MIPRIEPEPEAEQLLRPWSEIELTQIVLVLAAAWLTVFVTARLVSWFARQLPKRLRFYVLPWPAFVRLFVIVTAVALIVPMILVPRREAMYALAGSTAVALGFAFKDYVSSLIAGVVVLFERPCAVGDWIRVGDVYGRVAAMRLRVIELVTPDDDKVSIPHSKLWTEPIANANSGSPDHLCVADFYLDPAHDAAAVHHALEDVALTSAYRNLDRAVLVVAQEELFATHYRIKAYPFDGADQFRFTTDLTLRGRRVLTAMGARPASAPLALRDRST